MNLLEASIACDRILGRYPGFWCVAGGWAIDLFLGRQTRAHEDLEVAVLRNDYSRLFERVADYHPQKILSGDPPEFLPWDGTPIEPEVIQVRLDPVNGADFDLLLSPSAGKDWVCRRDESIRRPLSSVAGMTAEGIPFLNPEIVLLFKAKYVREKDALDFEAALPAMGAEARAWLRMALGKVHPGHGWLARLG